MKSGEWCFGATYQTINTFTKWDLDPGTSQYLVHSRRIVKENIKLHVEVVTSEPDLEMSQMIETRYCTYRL